MDNLKSTQIVVCLDIGDGECSAFALRRQGDSFAKDEGALYLADNIFRIPSVMYYDSEGNVTIGDMTVEDGCTCVSNFKKSPPNENFPGWDETCWQIGNGTKFRQCMFDFIHKLWENILFFNSGDGGVFKGKTTPKDMETVALFVGCPTSKNWLTEAQMTEYKNLISESTRLKNVFVIPESTASAFGAVVNNKSIKYLDGVAVFDFGSSTADFTYMHGDERRTCSWTLGASAIEETMYRLIYEDARFDLRDEDFPYRKTQRRNTFEIRVKAKEKYFLPYGEEKRTRKQEFAVRELNRFIDIDDKFMERVLNTPLQNPVWEDGDPQKSNGKKSWKQNCKDFLTRCNNIIVQDQLPVNRIVLAGGASNMHFIEELCYDIFGKTPDRNLLPYNSVSGGLCQVAKNTFLCSKILDEEINRWTTPYELKDLVTICETARNTITSILRETFENFIKEHPYTEYTFGRFKTAVNTYMNKHISDKKIENAVQIPTSKLLNYMTNKYTDIGHRCAEALYARNEFSCTWECKNDENIGNASCKDKSYDFCKDFEISTFLKGKYWLSYLNPFNQVPDDQYVINTAAYTKETPLFFYNVVTKIMSNLQFPYLYDSSVYARDGGKIDRFAEFFKKMLYNDTFNIIRKLALQTRDVMKANDTIDPSPLKSKSDIEYSYDDSETYTVGDLLRDMTW